MITIEQVIEQCAHLAEGWYRGAPIAEDIRALKAQYEGWVAVDTLRDTPTLDVAINAAQETLAKLKAREPK